MSNTAAPIRPSSTVRVLARACAAEWTRLWTVRVTWWFLVAAAVTMLGIGTALGVEVINDPASAQKPPAWTAGAITTVPAQFAFLALVLLAVTSEYATGAIVPTLQWTPRRAVLFTARTIVTVTVATTIGILLAVGASVAAWVASAARLQMTLGGLDTIGWVALVLGAGAAMTVGLGFLVRSTAGGLVTVFLVMLVLPLLLPMFGFDWMTAIGQFLPGTGVVFLLLQEGTSQMTTTRAVAVLSTWALGALLLGALRLVSSDTDR